MGHPDVPRRSLLRGLVLPATQPALAGEQGHWDEAIQVLADLHGDGDMDHPKVLADYQEIQGALRLEREEATSSMRTFAAPAW